MNITTTPYDLTNISNSNDMLQFVKEVNIITGNTFMLGILIVGFIIMFVSIKSNGNPTKDSLMASGFITVVLAVFFSALNFISTGVMTLIVVVFAIGFSFFMFRQD